MILSKKSILESVQNGNITIEPFNEKQLNPNSYNVRLDDICYILKSNHTTPNGQKVFDMANPSQYKEIKLKKSGTLLMPDECYLMQTVEIAGSKVFLPMLEGRSSIGRCFIEIHVCAGFGDIGFVGKWTLEVKVSMPTIIYPFIEIGQVYFQQVDNIETLYNGQYQGQDKPRISGIYKEINKND